MFECFFDVFVSVLVKAYETEHYMKLLLMSLIDNFPMNIQKYKIGGRKDNNGHWVWTDGQPVLHTYWAPGK